MFSGCNFFITRRFLSVIFLILRVMRTKISLMFTQQGLIHKQKTNCTDSVCLHQGKSQCLRFSVLLRPFRYMCTTNFMIGLHEKFTFWPLHIRNVSKGLIIGNSSNLETAITWSLAGCVAISLSCVPSKCGPIPTLSIRTPRSLRTRDGATISSPDDVVARTKSSWGILVLPLFLNHVVFKPVKLEPTT